MKFSYLHGAQGTPIRYSLESCKDKTRYVIAAFLCCLVVFGVTATQLVIASHSIAEASPNNSMDSTKDTKPKPKEDAVVKQPNTQITQFDSQKISAVLKKWITSNKGVSGVVISNQDGTVIAESNADKQFYMASLYKLYTAYLEYQKIDAGTYSLDDPYLNDWSRGKCLDQMIRTSDNPCGEKMMIEFGKGEINSRLRAYGLKNTSSSSFNTSAEDANIILANIQKGVDLSPSSRQRLLDSMAGQVYRAALPKGASDSKVYDKVGFREQTEYHDVGIIELADGRVLIVSVLTEKVGAPNIAKLAHNISEATKQ